MHRTGISGVASLYGEAEPGLRHAAGGKSGTLPDSHVCADGSDSGAGIQGKICHVGVQSVAEDTACRQAGLQYFLLCTVFVSTFLRSCIYTLPGNRYRHRTGRGNPVRKKAAPALPEGAYARRCGG